MFARGQGKRHRVSSGRGDAQDETAQTRQIHVGPEAIGGDVPVIVQSITSRPTGDEEAMFDQLMRLSVAGCELVRASLVAGGPFVLEAARATGA